ncbi:MAG TPA: HD domain-containing phosphohydrolase, partial [Candidatus Dormibacteraeota bacterium]|nr:HD domain-containing phosphohydrolase [Candidatus Dormibacteraeota bacterium]
DVLGSGVRIDAIVTDHRMPGASGIDVIAEAHKRDPLLPCVIVTAHDDLDLAVEAMRAGADAFLPKPFRPEHLLAVLDRTLERRRQATAWAAVPGDAAPLEGERAAVLATRIAQQVGLSEADVAAAGRGAALRDVGQPSSSARLLAATAGMPDAAEAIRRGHPAAGAALLGDVPGAAVIRLAILHHHERWDGSGYPAGLAGSDIPIVARIAAAVDAFEDLADGNGDGRRPTLREATVVLGAMSGTILDPVVVDALLGAINGDGRYVDVLGRSAADRSGRLPA